MFGLSTGLMSMLITTVIGAVFKLIAMKIESNKLQQLALLQRYGKQVSTTEKARTYRNKGFQITRRFIAISSVLAIIVVPLLYPIIFSLHYPFEMIEGGIIQPIWFGYEVIKSGFWPFTDSTTVTVWKEMTGVVITPFHTEVVGAIIGLYFGDRLGSANK